MTHPTTGSVLVKGGRVIDPASGFDQTADVLIVEGSVAEIGRVSEFPSDTPTLDAEGCIVSPGLIDIHVHFREPGQEHKETIATGTASAVAGGFTTVCCMPNTTPPIDSPAVIALIEKRAAQANRCRVFAVAAATTGRTGEAAGPLGALAEAGAVAFTDDGDCIIDARVMHDVLQLCREHDRPFMQHCQDTALTRDGVMNAGPVQTRLGLGGWPRVAEEIIIERDVRLNRRIGARYHVQHLSSGDSVDIVRSAQAGGQPVSAEVSPHHLLLTDEACEGYNTLAKMNPPLRSEADINAIKTGIADGTIQVLATDHAPHTAEEKALDFADAPFGIVGLDCALALYAKALIDDGVVDWPHMLGLMTHRPAALVGLDQIGLGSLTIGGPGDITVIDPNAHWTIEVEAFASKARNCPFDGWQVKAAPVATVVAGQLKQNRAGARLSG